MGDPATRRWAHQTGAKNSTKRKPVGWIPQIGDPHWRNRETAMVQVQRAMEVGMAATGRYMKPDGEITYEYKDVSSAPARNNPDRTAYMGTRRRAGTSTDPPQAVLRGRHDELYGPNTGQHASGVDPPWLVVAQRVSAVGYAAGKVQGRRRWDGGGDMHGEPGGDEKGKGKGRSRSRGRGKGRPRAGGRREPPGALRARRNAAMGHNGRHPLDGTPLARGAWVGAAEEAPAPLGGAQRQVGLGDPFWQARPAEELYRPRKPWRQPPSKRQPKPRAAAQKTQDEEEWLRQLAEDGDAVALIVSALQPPGAHAAADAYHPPCRAPNTVGPCVTCAARPSPAPPSLITSCVCLGVWVSGCASFRSLARARRRTSSTISRQARPTSWRGSPRRRCQVSTSTPRRGRAGRRCTTPPPAATTTASSRSWRPRQTPVRASPPECT
eukprot:COSAG01_NODE_1037_length_11984_cov_106.566176_3_plen_438_part_00